MDRIKDVIDSDDMRTCNILIIIATVVSMVILFLMPAPEEFDVVNFYNQSELMKSGLLPYTDFVFEFPPFALIFFAIPGLFTSEMSTYALIFGLMVIAFVAVTIHYIQRICDRIGINKILVSILFIAMILVYFPVRKYDVFPMCITTIALYYFIERRFGIAYSLAAFATLTKIYPGLIIILFLLINITENEEGKAKNVAVGLLSCILVAALAFIPLLIAGIPMTDALSFLTFHSDRGFQNESLFAIVVATLSMIGLTESHIEFNHDAYDIVGPLTDAVMPYWTFITVMTIVAVLLIITRYISIVKHDSGRGWNGRVLIVTSTMMILAFLLVNKVFSTQYLVWLMPMMACIPAMFRKNQGMAYIAVFLTVGLSTAYLMCESNSVPFLVLNIIRDIILIFIFTECVRAILHPKSKESLLEMRE